jgi:hypothetical protein
VPWVVFIVVVLVRCVCVLQAWRAEPQTAVGCAEERRGGNAVMGSRPPDDASIPAGRSDLPARIDVLRARRDRCGHRCARMNERCRRIVSRVPPYQRPVLTSAVIGAPV